jgi:hypothetical protein
MSYKGDLMVREETLLTTTFNAAMACVYQWMAAGLGLTAVVAIVVARSGDMASAIFGSPWTALGLFLVQMALVIGISAAIDKVAPGVALGLFFLYSGLMGVTLSVVLLVYDLGTIWQAFGVTGTVFVLMSAIGLTTKKDLSGWGPILLASLFGLIITGVANWLLQNGALEWVFSFAGVAVFMGLTLYDSQKIKTMTAEALAHGEEQVVSRVGVLGALTLYLDVFNLFLFILNILDGDRD